MRSSVPEVCRMAVLYFDVTKSIRQKHYSGLRRLNRCLGGAFSMLPDLKYVECRWSYLRFGYVECGTGRRIVSEPEACFLTPEVFALRERPFSKAWLSRYRGRSASIFYDCIPYRYPHFTWPKSVRRFKPWFEGLSSYDTLFYISSAVQKEAERVGKAFGVCLPEGLEIPLGANFQAEPIVRTEAVSESEPVLLSTGIIEPRKGYSELIDAAEAMWARGVRFRLVILGRINPHFGRPIVERMEKLKSEGRSIRVETAAGDDRLAYWLKRASLVVQPSLAEGFGLPVYEALWAGCPVLCSSQPCLENIVEEKGYRLIPEVTADALEGALSEVLERGQLEALEKEAGGLRLPTWESTARRIYRDWIQSGNR